MKTIILKNNEKIIIDNIDIKKTIENLSGAEMKNIISTFVEVFGIDIEKIAKKSMPHCHNCIYFEYVIGDLGSCGFNNERSVADYVCFEHTYIERK